MAKKLQSLIFPLTFFNNPQPNQKAKLIGEFKNQKAWDAFVSSLTDHTEQDFLDSHGMSGVRTFWLGSRGPGGAPLKNYLQK